MVLIPYRLVTYKKIPCEKKRGREVLIPYRLVTDVRVRHAVDISYKF